MNDWYQCMYVHVCTRLTFPQSETHISISAYLKRCVIDHRHPGLSYIHVHVSRVGNELDIGSQRGPVVVRLAHTCFYELADITFELLIVPRAVP